VTRTHLARSSLAAVIAAVLAPALSYAGTISGQVTDKETGRPLPDAIVTIEGSGRTTTTDRSGRFRLVEVPGGTRSLRVRSVGYGDGIVSLEVPQSGEFSTDVGLSALGVSEEIVVIGFRVAQLTSLQAKKSAVGVLDAVTGDDAGKLPDMNAAESLQRVPGTSLTLDQGEGRYISIRGIDAGLNNVTIDGQTIGAPEAGDRRIALDTIPADVLSRLEVRKTITPDLDGNAVGGAINLVTPSAFDHAELQRVTGSAEIGYYDLNGESPTAGALTFSGRLGGDESFGLVLSASYSDRQYASENIQGGAEWEEEGDYLIPDEYVLRDYELQRIRMGIVANFEYRPNDDLKLYWRNLWNEFEDTEQRQQAIIDYRNGDLLDQTATSGTFTEAEGERLVKFRREEQAIFNSTLGGEYKFGRSTLSGSIGYGQADQDTPFDNEWSFESSDAFAATYDTSRFFWRVDGGEPFLDAAAYEYNEVVRARQLVEEDLLAAQIDFHQKLDFGAYPGFWKVGAKFTGRDKESDAEGDVYDGFDGDFTLDSVARPGPRDFLSSVARYYNFGPRVDYGAAEAVFVGQRGSFERSDLDSLEESLAADYTAAEDISAGYVMAGAELGRWSLVGGVRVERTDAEYSAFDLVFEDGDLDPDAVTLRKGGNDYTNYLPSLHAQYWLREDLIVRGAWTNTIGRPAYESLVPLREFEIDPDGSGGFEGSVVEGNPQLDPLESMNFDLSVEWYPRPAGLVSIALFHKDIENPVYTEVTELEDEFYEGRFFSELSIERPRNAVDGQITGVEVNLQQQFTALPAPFDGFGAAVNYTWTDSEATIFGRDKEVPFFLQPEHVGNVAVFYEKFGFEGRIAYTYRSDYLDEVAGDAEQDIYVDSRSQLDLKLAYAVAEHWRVFVEFRNLTDEPWRYLNGNKRLAENEIYSWNAAAGVQVRF
jgi:TonB-dependent receptor